MRLYYTLSTKEIDELDRIARSSPLPTRGERIWDFWKRIAHENGMRHDSLMGEGNTVSGLPLGSEKHWCWPVPLKCSYNPS